MRPILLSLAIILLTSCGETPELKGVAANKTLVELTVSTVNSGTVTAEHEAELSFGTVGRVQKLDAKVGVAVKKDQILAELENVDLRTAFETAKQDLIRAKELYSSKAISIQDVEGRQRTLDLTQGNFEKSLIRAPFDGLITEVNLDVGQLSQITAVIPKPLIKIVDMEPRYIESEIDEVDLPRITVGLSARAKILAVRREPFKAKIRRVVPYISTLREQDRTSLIELSVDSEGVLLPAGASADIEIIAERKEQVLAVPARAVLGRGGDRYVYKFTDGRAVMTPVKLGIGNYDRIEILSGLAAGDVVLYPSENVEFKDKMKVKAIVSEWP